MTSQSNVDMEHAIRLASSMIGEYVWFVRCVEDRILRLEFGAPHLRVHEPNRTYAGDSERLQLVFKRRVVVPSGQWHLFVENGYWSVEAGTLKCSRSDGDRTAIDSCLSQLSGQKLEEVSFAQSQYVWIFKFDLGSMLRITSGSTSQASSQWTLFFDGKGNLSYFGPNAIV